MIKVKLSDMDVYRKNMEKKSIKLFDSDKSLLKSLHKMHHIEYQSMLRTLTLMLITIQGKWIWIG